jgi:succinate dehydrogenase/fumarate reductase cytochrome b subunit
MDAILRIVAIVIEVLILSAIAYAVFNGIRLAALDLGVKARYNRAIVVMLVAVGFILLIFFIAHLTTFYPGGLVDR